MNEQFIELMYADLGKKLDYDYNQKKWVTEDIDPGTYHCKSYKAFKKTR